MSAVAKGRSLGGVKALVKTVNTVCEFEALSKFEILGEYSFAAEMHISAHQSSIISLAT